MTHRGIVAIVGAGPGDPELITVKGLERVRMAEVLVYDRLVNPLLLEEAPRHAELIYAGKSAGCVSMTQREIERVLISHARKGFFVVRLKGGDPFVFGRGAEELTALVEAGIETEVIPGLSSAFAVPAGANIPVTHRDYSSSVTIVTGHEDPGKVRECADWDHLAAGNGTLVILMGLRKLQTLTQRLIDAGRAPGTPAAAISHGTLPDEQVVVAPLAHLAMTVNDAMLDSPVTIVVGDVVRFRELVHDINPLASAIESIR